MERIKVKRMNRTIKWVRPVIFFLAAVLILSPQSNVFATTLEENTDAGASVGEVISEDPGGSEGEKTDDNTVETVKEGASETEGEDAPETEDEDTPEAEGEGTPETGDEDTPETEAGGVRLKQRMMMHLS